MMSQILCEQGLKFESKLKCWITHRSKVTIVFVKSFISFYRYALGEALGVGWADTYPVGYGFNDKKEFFSGIDKGPFFTSVHTGDRPSDPCSNCGRTEAFLPDVARSSVSYTHRGWYSLRGQGLTGQMSNWFK